jgi:hypothetical protein
MTTTTPIHTLRAAIVDQTNRLAMLQAHTDFAPNTTQDDARVKYHRIYGLIRALDIIGGDSYGLRVALRRALDTALPNCIEWNPQIS